ncbi:MAG: hypothetical protein V4489_10090 [Chlamydiota bacterium]
MDQVNSVLAEFMKTVGKGLILYPPQLNNVICAEQLGIVTEVRKIKIDSISAPYNASIIEKEGGGYHLFFRHDEARNAWKTPSFYSNIGYAELDDNLSVVNVTNKVETGSRFSEDPRIVRVGKTLYLSWNDAIDEDNYARSIHLGEWNPQNRKLEYVTNLQQYIAPVEKNWVPFEKKEKEETSLSFVYGIYPHKIIGVANPECNEISHPQYKGYNALHDLRWTKLWGIIRGGTTARLVGKEYISFFHSSFKEGGKVWYVMGAYTFEAKAPHKITSVTQYPILFPGIYTSEMLNTADATKYCIFPAGLAIEEKEGKTLLHVSCGENDSAVKIVTIDYKKLKEMMVSVK